MDDIKMELPKDTSEKKDKEKEKGKVKGKEKEKDKDKEKDKEKDEEKEKKEKEFKEKVKGMSTDEKIKKSLDLKLEGNEEYKNKNFHKAIDKYEEGLKYLGEVEHKNAKIDELDVALNLNLSLCYSNVEEYNEAYKYIQKVLKIDQNNAKGLFRLCQIEFNRCNFEIAKERIQEFIKIYPDNIEAKKLLKNIILKLNEHNKKQKEAYSNIFEKASGLYEDREKEILRQKKEKYEKDMKEREMKNEEMIDFEKWEELENEKRIKEEEKQRKENEEKEKEKEREREREKKRKENSNRNKHGSSSSNSKNDSSYLEMDEEDEKIISETKKMGYCYFKKDIKEDDKKLFEKNIPKKIDGEEKTELNNFKNENKALSSWNAAGTTYEEKDMTNWAQKKIEECLKNVTFVNEKTNCVSGKENAGNKENKENEENGGLDCSSRRPVVLPVECIKKFDVTDIKDLSVDAQVVVIRGTKRHIFELSGNLHITIYTYLPDLKSHKVVVEIKELSSELEAGKTWKHFINVKKNDKLKMTDGFFDAVYETLVEAVEKQIKVFTEEYSKF